jgi:hypothetical protein
MARIRLSLRSKKLAANGRIRRKNSGVQQRYDDRLRCAVNGVGTVCISKVFMKVY